MDLEVCFLTGFRQGLEEILAIHLSVEDGLPETATTHDVIAGTEIFDA